jgi:hypothetical protein
MQVGGQEFEGPARRRIPGEHRRVLFARHNAGWSKTAALNVMIIIWMTPAKNRKPMYVMPLRVKICRGRFPDQLRVVVECKRRATPDPTVCETDHNPKNEQQRANQQSNSLA